MRKKQLVVLCLCSLLYLTMGNGLVPLLPVYAIQLGAAPAVIGFYLSFTYLALSTGTVVAGWLSDKFQRRKALFIVGSVVGIPVIWLMGRAMTIWHLAALTAGVWFLGGMGLTLVSILTGLFANEAERGKIFGILALTRALGALIGGTMTGPIADRWGYPTLFRVLALFFGFSALIALLLEDKIVVRAQQDEASTTRRKSGLGKSFFLLFLATMVAATADFMGNMGRSLAMDGLGFGAAAISSTAAIGGAVALPLPPLVGWLSDRVGRKRLLALCHLIGNDAAITILKNCRAAMTNTIYPGAGAILLTEAPGTLELKLQAQNSRTAEVCPETDEAPY